MVQLVFENEYVICQLDDSLPVLKHRWKKEMSSGIFQENLLRINQIYIDIRNSYKRLSWLADTQLLGEVGEETEKWFEEVWEDLLFGKAGVKIHAVILGEDFYAEYPMEKFKMDAEQKFKDKDVQLGVFADEEEAYDWIRTR